MNIHRSEPQIKFSFDRKDWDIDGGQAVRDFVGDLKAHVPASERDYDSLFNEWTINADFAPVIDELRERYFPD